MGTLFIQAVIIGIMNGCIYILAGLGWMIVHNVTRVLNFTQGEFVMLGGMLAVTAIGMGCSLPIAFLIAVAITIIIAYLIERIVIRPLKVKEMSDLTIMIATFAAALSIRTGALMIWGWEPKSLLPFTSGDPIYLFGAAIVRQTLWVIGVTLVMVTGVFLFFRRTIIGRALIATSLDSDAARLMGINPARMSIIAFILAGSLGSAGGIVAAPILMTSFSIGLMVSLKGLIATVIGGFEPKGVLIIALLIGVLENIAAAFLSSGFKDIISLTTVVLVLVLLMPRMVSQK